MKPGDVHDSLNSNAAPGQTPAQEPPDEKDSGLHEILSARAREIISLFRRTGDRNVSPRDSRSGSPEKHTGNSLPQREAPGGSPGNDEALAAIRASDLFDENWYLAHYTDVAREGIEPALHYLRTGGFKGYDPGPDFSSAWYLCDGNHFLRDMETLAPVSLKALLFENSLRIS